jgi:hypothetical protein
MNVSTEIISIFLTLSKPPGPSTHRNFRKFICGSVKRARGRLPSRNQHEAQISLSSYL